MISITELHDRFDLEIDKYGSPYFTTNEKDYFLNAAQYALIKDFVYNRSLDKKTNGQSKIKYEDNENIADYLSTITVQSSSPTAMSTAGRVLRSEIIASTGFDYLYVLSLLIVKNGIETVAKYARHNDIHVFEKNYFKKPSDCRIYYTYFDGYLQIYPKTTKASFIIETIKKPAIMNFTTPVDCDLDYLLVNELVNRAVELASVSIRDAQLYNNTVNEGNNTQL